MPGEVLKRFAGSAAFDQSQNPFVICFADRLVRARERMRSLDPEDVT